MEALVTVLWPTLGTLLFLLGFGALVLRWLAFCGAPLPAPFSDPLPPARGEPVSRREQGWIFLLALLYRLCFALAGLLLYNALTGAALSITQLPQLWSRWDAPHYLQLAQLGYGGYLEEGKPLFLVFFPLYVWLIRPLGHLLGNTAWAGLVVSWLCFAGGCTAFYTLGCEEYGPVTARRSLLLLLAFPFSFFFGGIMTESLFLLTTTAALLAIRQHRWGRAALWGILASLTRMQGVLLIGAALAEWGNALRPFSLPRTQWKLPLRQTLRKLPLLCLPVVGSVLYLLLNWSVTGDPFAFTEMQKHWSQGFQWFPGVVSYLLKNSLNWPTLSTRWEMWIPELLLFFLTALLLLRSWKGHRSMFTLYATVSFLLTYCLSWLLSAGRYLSCNVPLFFFAATRLSKPQARGLAALLFLLQAAFLFRYFCWGQVM